MATFSALLLELYSRANQQVQNMLKPGWDGNKFNPEDYWPNFCDWLDDHPVARTAALKALGLADSEEDTAVLLAAKDADESYARLPGWLTTQYEDDLGTYLDGRGAHLAPTSTHLTAQRQTLLPRTTWLVHFSYQAEAVAQQGFRKGFSDHRRMGLTMHFPEDAPEKAGAGYNFAFLASSPDAVNAADTERYGDGAVMFQNSGVQAYHKSDEEVQIMFRGDQVDPAHLVHLKMWNDHSWSVMSKVSRRALMSGSFEECVTWVTQNFAQYQRQFATLGKPYNKQTMQLTEKIHSGQVKKTPHQSSGEPTSQYPLVQEVYSKENQYLRNHLRQREKAGGVFDYAHHWFELAEILGNDEELLEICVEVSGNAFETPEDVEAYGPELWKMLPVHAQHEAEQQLEGKWEYDDANSPTERHMSLRNSKKVLPSTTWLVHFSDHAQQIATQGFKIGFEDAHRLGLTSHFDADAYEKSGVGYNFAFLVGSPEATEGFRSNYQGGKPKYGRDAVVFQASGVAVDHHGDEEQQIIFYGAYVNPRNIVFLRNERDGDWAIPDPKTNRIIYQGEGDKCATWVTQNFAQYQRQFASPGNTYNKQTMQLTEELLQKAVARYCSENQDAIRTGKLTQAMLEEGILTGVTSIFGGGGGPLKRAKPMDEEMGSDALVDECMAQLEEAEDLLNEAILLEKNVPNNPGLWANCKAAAKRKFDVYPSAYANGYAAKQYKSKGGTWKKGKTVSEEAASQESPEDLLSEKKSHGGLDKWFKEKWVDISKKDDKGKHPACGREDTSKGGYPKCRKSSVAAQMSDKDVKNSVARKRSAESKGDSGKRSPNVSS